MKPYLLILATGLFLGASMLPAAPARGQSIPDAEWRVCAAMTPGVKRLDCFDALSAKYREQGIDGKHSMTRKTLVEETCRAIASDSCLAKGRALLKKSPPLGALQLVYQLCFWTEAKVTAKCFSNAMLRFQVLSNAELQHTSERHGMPPARLREYGELLFNRCGKAGTWKCYDTYLEMDPGQALKQLRDAGR